MRVPYNPGLVSIAFHNTMTRSLEPFEPIDPPKVRMYTCGPTVYNCAHIGNLRAYIFEDLLRRHLRFRGYDVNHIMNLTDVDDKTIRGCNEKGISLDDFTRPFKDAFFEDLKTLNIVPADAYPAATDHIAEMIELIQRLFDKELAYQSDDGSVYFSISRYPNYGKLAHLDLDGLRPGARVNQDEYEKESCGDFALWKAWVPADGDVGWDSPWGRGRPGWHIECSAMAMKFLSESFDIHCGGGDNIFPHHEDEIAQSEGATGKPFARYWIHNAHLVVDGKKMAKSEGNFYTLRDLMEKGYAGREIRYVLLANSHYRQSLNFSLGALDAARSSLARLDEFRTRMIEHAGDAVVADPGPKWLVEAEKGFAEGLDDDLSVSNAMAALFDLVRAGNKALDGNDLDAAGAAAVVATWHSLDEVLGFLQPDDTQVDSAVEELVQRRQGAREAKDWAESDRLRDELAGLGWQIKDTPQGPKLKKV